MINLFMTQGEKKSSKAALLPFNLLIVIVIVTQREGDVFLLPALSNSKVKYDTEER